MTSASAAEQLEKNRDWLINSIPDACITVADLLPDVLPDDDVHVSDSNIASSRSVCVTDDVILVIQYSLRCKKYIIYFILFNNKSKGAHRPLTLQ